MILVRLFRLPEVIFRSAGGPFPFTNSILLRPIEACIDGQVMYNSAHPRRVRFGTRVAGNLECVKACSKSFRLWTLKLRGRLASQISGSIIVICIHFVEY